MVYAEPRTSTWSVRLGAPTESHSQEATALHVPGWFRAGRLLYFPCLTRTEC